MKAKTEVIYTERHNGVYVAVRYWNAGDLFIYSLYWERYEYVAATPIWSPGHNKPVSSGAELLDVESDAEAQRIGIAKFDALMAEGDGV